MHNTITLKIRSVPDDLIMSTDLKYHQFKFSFVKSSLSCILNYSLQLYIELPCASLSMIIDMSSLEITPNSFTLPSIVFSGALKVKAIHMWNNTSMSRSQCTTAWNSFGWFHLAMTAQSNRSTNKHASYCFKESTKNGTILFLFLDFSCPSSGSERPELSRELFCNRIRIKRPSNKFNRTCGCEERLWRSVWAPR